MFLCACMPCVHSAQGTGWDASHKTAVKVGKALSILSKIQLFPPLQVFIELCCLPVQTCVRVYV
jgi:hypothetical protein